MSVGSESYLLSKNKLASFVGRILGTSDVHTHFRTRPLMQAIKKTRMPVSKVLEPGCGSGSNLFWLDRYFNNSEIIYHGYDLNSTSIDTANRIKAKLNRENLTFSCRNIVGTDLGQHYDLVLLIDVLEHIDCPQDFLKALKTKVKEGATIFISVPTPNYPKIFGREFHESVGHLVDGYTLDALSTMLKKAGYRVVSHTYNTGFIANVLCLMYYRFIRKVPSDAIRAGFGWLFSLWRWFDIFNHPRISSSLFVVATNED